MSHSLSPGNPQLSPQGSPPVTEPKGDIGNIVELEPDYERRELALRRLSDIMMISLGAEFAEASDRKLLEQLYFSKLHLHWPILHQNTFRSKTQPEQLVQAVLIAGLWMTGTAKARQQVEFHHDKIVEIQCENSVNHPFLISQASHRPIELIYMAQVILDQQSDIFNAPRPEFLAFFQAFMISIILLIYRAANGIPSDVVDNKRLLRLTVFTKRLFRLFNHAGVFDQQRIDAENPLNTILREQYQRLAVILFKAFVHLNAILTTHLPKFRLLDNFDPSMLNVRVPSSQEIWNASNKDYSQDVDGRPIIGSLFIGDTNNTAYQTLTSISACDFSTGMILGCFHKRQPDEPLLQASVYGAADEGVILQATKLHHDMGMTSTQNQIANAMSHIGQNHFIFGRENYVIQHLVISTPVLAIFSIQIRVTFPNSCDLGYAAGGIASVGCGGQDGNGEYEWGEVNHCDGRDSYIIMISTENAGLVKLH
ncbi:hypothetical protein V493_08616 [Pseudogymnoascus sp. VKM F-4281 (FW-2241)]|nr:hypothetical protein V493_08616 [Pseudogymnoascus sp. VKM F-4281 (FW-2241)]